MSDLVTAGKVAERLVERMKLADQLAQPGTWEHGNILGTTLVTQHSQIMFCLEVLMKQR